MVIRFDGRNPRAETWLTDHSSDLITRVVEDQKEAVRARLRDGMEAGENPKTTALEIVGRLNKATGKREGGIVGLSAQQERFLANMKAELRDPAKINDYFGRKLRDKRYDRLVMKAARDGKPVSEADIRNIAQRYSDRLLKHRGDMIARTESLTALHVSQDEAYRQLIETGKVRAEQVTKTWSATMDGRTRDTHAHLNGEKLPFNGVFVSQSGARLRFPQDTALGAGPDETIACRCLATYRVNYL